MRQQYIVSDGTFYRWITTYRDGVKIENTKVWLDDYDEFIDDLEAEGYERAYTKEKVQEAKEEYERLLAMQLVEEVR